MPVPIRRLLVANRGEIARRIIGAAHDLGMQTVGMYSDADADARYVQECDLAVRLPGTSPAQTYLDVAAVVSAAVQTGADAVHPGYGFLAENADAAQAVVAAGLTWVGPEPEAMRAMARKLTAKSIVAAAGVPVLPSQRLDGDDPADWVARAAEVGYPLLVKASAGGGGRGMRVVQRRQDLAESVQAARREADAAFGDPTVYAERYVARGRHVEVQVVGDGDRVLHLFERECSLQRRHQKILEETPSPGTHPAVLQRMYAAAVAAAEAVEYRSLGTVEFLLDDPDEGAEPGSDPQASFYFLEMNTRLQVEHPVTELVTGLDLVQTQLRLAAGAPLDLRQDDIVRHGNAVEVRLVAENPAAGWVPSAGLLERFEMPEVSGVRWDSGVRSGSTVAPHYDSLLAKVIAHGSTRFEALDRLRRALDGLRVHGVDTNRDALRVLVDDADVRAGRTTIDLLGRRHGDLAASPPAWVLAQHGALASLAAYQQRASTSPAAGLAPPGWRSLADASEHTSLIGPSGRLGVTVRTDRAGTVHVSVDDQQPWSAVVHAWDGEVLDVELDGVRRRAAVLLEPEHDGTDRRLHVFSDGWCTDWTEPARLPAGNRVEAARGPSSPVPGTVVAVHVEPGDIVAAGDGLVVLEAMKMEHHLTADADAAVVEVVVQVGDAVDAHEVLVVLEPLGAPSDPEEAVSP